VLEFRVSVAKRFETRRCVREPAWFLLLQAGGGSIARSGFALVPHKSRAASSETYIEHFCSSPSVGGTGFFFARLFVPVARLFLLSNLLSFVGRNQTQTTKDSLDRTLSDTTTAKSTVHLSSEDREQLADAMREGEFDWAQSMLPGAAEQEETKPASQEVGNPKI
jgi:hypothetical protein